MVGLPYLRILFLRFCTSWLTGSLAHVYCYLYYRIGNLWRSRYAAELRTAGEEAGTVAWVHRHTVGSSSTRHHPPRRVPERLPRRSSTAATATTSGLSTSSTSLQHGREDTAVRRERALYSMWRSADTDSHRRTRSQRALYWWSSGCLISACHGNSSFFQSRI